MHASDLTRYREWLTIHKVWRSKLPEVLEKGTVVESYVEVKGMPNRIKWTIVRYKPRGHDAQRRRCGWCQSQADR